MPASNDATAAADLLALMLGPRQADILRLLWARGPSTVAEIHKPMRDANGLAYTTVMTLCVRLFEKGVLERTLVEPRSLPGRANAYVYAPRVAEEEFVRSTVEQQLDTLLASYPALVRGYVARYAEAAPQPACDRPAIEPLLAYLGALHDSQGHPTNDRALDTITALLERAEAAERQAAAWADKARRAEVHAAIAERRLALKQPEEQGAPVQNDQNDPAGVCRVCGDPAPPARASRKDGLRVCANPACRAEARRRDNAAKARRARRRHAQPAAP